MTEKQECPLCKANVINLSRHLVLHHNVRNSDDLKTKVLGPTRKKTDRGSDNILKPLKPSGAENSKSKLIHPLTPKKPDPAGKISQPSIKTPEESNRKNIITTAIKLRNEKVARTKIRLIQRMSRLILVSNVETNILNEGIEALLTSLKHNSKSVRDQAILELEKILSDSQSDPDLKDKIRSHIE